MKASTALTLATLLLAPGARAGELVALVPAHPAPAAEVSATYGAALQQSFRPAPWRWENSELSIGAGLSNFSYGEEIAGSGKSTEAGLVKSVTVGYRAGFRNGVGLSLSLDVGGGSSSYVGTTQGGDPLTGKTGNLFIRGELGVSYKVLDSHPGELRVYAGQSYRVWRRDLASDTSSGYRESYAMTHFAAGAQYRHFLTPAISIAPDVSVRYLAGGSVKADLVKHSYRELEMPLGGRMGARIAAPVTFWSLFGDGVSLVATPYYEYVGIGKGSTVALQTLEGGAVRNAEGRNLGWFEPASSTHSYGITGSVQLHW